MWICVWLPLVFLSAVRAHHRCYVCVPPEGTGGEVEGLFPNTKLSLCGGPLDVRVCPEGYAGCLTQTKGNRVTRTCSNLDVETCQVLNGVQYCYCRGELCNAAAGTPNKPPPDDEDTGEGSGSDPTVAITTLTQVLLPKLTTTSAPPLSGSGAVVVSFTFLVITSTLVMLC